MTIQQPVEAGKTVFLPVFCRVVQKTIRIGKMIPLWKGEDLLA